MVIVGALLLWATGDFADFGAPDSPASAAPLSSHYIENVVHETKVPNMVTAVLASYRGYDTLGETTVILTAGVVVLLLMRRRKRGGLE